jgi:helix-turn-helix protein
MRGRDFRENHATGARCARKQAQNRHIDANREQAETFSGRIAPIRRTKPQKQQNPPLRGGLVARRTGEYRDLSNPILSENLNRCKPFLGFGGALPEIVRAPRRDLIPNGEVMLAEHFRNVAAGARTSAALDETARLLWRAHAEAQIPDTEAGAISEAIEGRRAILTGKGPVQMPRLTLGRPGASRRQPRQREKMFGLGRPRALDRNAKVRIMHWARCLARRTEKGRAYGVITAKALAVLEALLWAFHNAKSGLCFPSYERIAEAAHCARSTVAEAIRALEDAGVLSWVQRIKRVREACPDLLGANGWRWRVLRTSNAYNFCEPGSRNSSRSDFQSGTPIQEFFSPMRSIGRASEHTGTPVKPTFEMGGSNRLPPS